MYNIHCANGKSKPFLKKNQIFSRFFALEQEKKLQIEKL